MWLAPAIQQPSAQLPTILTVSPNSKLLAFSFSKTKPCSVNFRSRLRKLKVSAAKKQLPESQTGYQDEGKLATQETGIEKSDSGWLPAFPHVLVASMANFAFGYHIGSIFFLLYLYSLLLSSGGRKHF